VTTLLQIYEFTLVSQSGRFSKIDRHLANLVKDYIATFLTVCGQWCRFFEPPCVYYAETARHQNATSLET